MSIRQGVVLCCLIMLLLPMAASAQTVTGTMQGTVSDRSGAAVPGVTVTIRNDETGLQRVVVTNQAGFFSAPFLPIGRYDVTTDLSGFGVQSRRNAGLDLNQTTVQDFVLDPAVSETVTVSADTPRINVSDGEIKQTMRESEIMSIPQANQTSFLGLAATFSGYQEPAAAFRESQDNPTASVGSSANFNGAGTRGTSFQINGVNNDDSSENQNRQGVSLATIKSFQVLSNSFSAEFGRGYGAVVLVQTKSGTNQVTGELYGYQQKGTWAEKDKLTVTQAKPTFYRKQFGITAGFPILHDTLFAFVNFDGVERKGNVIATRGLILPSDLAGPRLNLNNDTPANRAWQDAILARFPQSATPNAPQISNRAYQYPQFQNFPDRDYSGRLDWNATASNSINARYQRTGQQRITTETIIGEAALQDNKQSNLGVTWTNILSANTVQEARYGLGLRSTNVDILSGNDTPIVRFAGTLNGPIIGNAGVFPINRNQRDQQFVYNLSSAHWSRHTLKSGMDIRRSALNDRASSNNRGFWNFTSTCGGVTYPSAIAAFWAGCVSTFSKSFGPDYLENRINEQNFYAQDDWRPTDNLTFNLGVRYERAGAPKEIRNRIDYLYGDTSYVDPRLGFAYTPDWDGNQLLRAVTGGNGRFSIRGGFGVYHGRVFQSVFSQSGNSVRYNPPNALSVSPVSQTNLSDPTNGFQFVPGVAPAGIVSLTTINPDLQMPETRQWNLTFERQLFSKARLRASYIGTMGRNLLQFRFDNLPIRPDDPNSKYRVAADPACAGTGLPGSPITAACPKAVPIADDEISLRVLRLAQRRPDARYGTNLIVDNLAKSWYHAAQFELESGLVGGFQGRMTYTFGKAIDTGSESTPSGTGDINTFPPGYDDYKRGLSRFDTRHRFTATASYALPWLKNREGFLPAVLSGWQIATVVRLSSGTPFTIVDGAAPDIDFDGVSNFRPVVVNPQYAGGWHVNTPVDSQKELPRNAFRRVTFGDKVSDLIGRNTYFSDGAETFDLKFSKNVKMRGRNAVIVGMDIFNLFNHVTWGFPVNDINNANFGKILSTAYAPRTYQATIRFLY